MKKKILIMAFSVLVLFVSLSSFNAQRSQNQMKIGAQEVNTMDASYIGYSANGYRFTTYINDELQIFVFQKVADGVLSKFDLKSNKLINYSFNITYQRQSAKVATTGGSNSDAEQINVITKLENNY